MTEAAGDGFVAYMIEHGVVKDAPRRGDWMQTATGRQYWPLDPRPEEVDIVDIASALSMLCRYGGHVTRFYSVAEHSVHMADAAPVGHKLTALLHDASEAYIVDVIRPIKPFLTGYSDIEDRNMRAIAQRFGIAWPLSAEVKRLDNAILADEQAQVMAPAPSDWRLPEPPLGIFLPCWSPDQAKHEFLMAFRRYGGRA